MLKSLFALPRGFSQTRLWCATALIAALTWLVTPGNGLGSGIPDRSELLTASGKVTRVASHRHGVKFVLSGVNKTFEYPRADGVVLSSLRSASDNQVNVLYFPHSRKPLSSEVELFDVWEVSVGNRTIRTLSESIEGWKSNEAIRPWLAGCFGLFTIYFFTLSVRKHRAQKLFE